MGHECLYYYSVEEYTKSKNCRGDSNSFRLLYLNARSIRKHGKFDNLKELISDLLPSAVAVTETWLSENEEEYYKIPGYSLFVSSRTSHRGGGVLLYVSNARSSKLIKTDGADHSTLTVKLKSSEISFNITVAYNPNERNTPNLDETLDSLFSCMLIQAL